MARSRFTHNSFATGFINKNIQGNSEFEQYNNALAKCTNFYVLPTGGVQKRAGTIYLSTLDYKKNKLIPYIVSRVENYMLVFSDKLLRIFTKYGEIDLGSSYTLDFATYVSESNEIVIYYNNDPNKTKKIKYNFFPNTAKASLITVGTYPMYYILYPTTNEGINDIYIYISTNLEDWNKIILINNNTDNFTIYNFSVVGNTLSVLLKKESQAQIAYIRGVPDLFDLVHLTDILNVPAGYYIVRAAIVTHDDASKDYPIIVLKERSTLNRLGISVSFSFSNITMLNLSSNSPYKASEYPVFIANTTQKGIVSFFIAGAVPGDNITSNIQTIKVTESDTSPVPSVTIVKTDTILDKYLHSSYIQYPDLTTAIGIKTTNFFSIINEKQNIKQSNTANTSNYIFPSFISDDKVGFIVYDRGSKTAYLYLTDNKANTFSLAATADEKNISFNVNILRGMPTDFDESIIDSLKTFSIKNNLFIVCDKGIYSLSRLEATKFELKKLDEPFSIPPLTFLQETSVYLEAEEDTKDPAGASTDEQPKYILTPKSGDKSDPDKEYWPVFFNEDKNNLLVCLFNVESKLFTYYLNITKVEQVQGKRYNKIYASVDTALSPYKLTKKEGEAEKKSWKLPDIDKLIENWQIGCMNEKRGWPTECELFEGRLFVANTISYDLGLWASNLNYGDLLNFNVENNSASGLQKQVRIEQAGEILWLSAINKLFIGTLGGVCVVGSGTYQDEGLTPEKFVVRLFDALRPSALQPAKVKDAIFFVDQTGANVYEIVLDSSLGAYRANNISLLANELTKSGIISHTFLQSPVYSYWAALKNGRLAQMTYQKNNNVIAWSDHEIAGLHSRVISICALPNDDKDALWMVVSRTIKNKDLITLEYMPAPYDPIIQDSFKQIFSDSCVIQEHKRTIVDIDNSIDSTIFADFSFVKDVLKRNSCEALFMQEIKDLKRTYSMLGFKKGTNKLVLILLNDPIEQIDISDNHPLTAIYAAFKDNENIYIAGKNNQNKIGVAYSNNGGHSFVFNAIQFDNMIKNIYRFESIIVNNSKKLYLLTDYAIYLLNNTTTNAWIINSIINCFYLYDNKYAEIIHFDKYKNSISYIYQSTNNLLTFNKHLENPSRIILTENNLCGVISFQQKKFLVLFHAKGIIRYTLIGSKNAYSLWIEHTTQIPINSKSVYDFFMISNSIYLAYLSNENIFKIAKLDIIKSADDHLYTTNVRDNILINVFSNVNTAKFYQGNIKYKIIATSNTKIYIAYFRSLDQIILEKQYDITADLSDTTKVNMDTTPTFYQNFLLETVKLQLNITNNSRATIRNIISDDLDPQLLDIQKIKTQYPQIETTLYECGILCSTIVKITPTYIVCDASMLSTNDQILISEDTRILPSLEIDSRKHKIIYKINRIVGNDIYLVNALDNTPIVLSNSANLDLEQTKLYIYKIITNKQKAEIRLGSDTRITVTDNSSLPKLHEGEEVYINTVWGLSDINNKKYKINSVTQKSEYLEITLYDISQSNLENNTLAPLDTVNKGFYDNTIENNGNLYSYFDSVPIPHLIGEEVVIMADGNYVGSKIVGSSGVITLDNPAMYCVIGLQFTSSLQTVSFSGGSQIGSSIGGVTSQKDIILSLYNSLGGKYGTEITNMYPIPYARKIELDQPAELFTGLKKLPVIKSKNIYERSTCIEHSEPVNFTLLALTEDTEVSDG